MHIFLNTSNQNKLFHDTHTFNNPYEPINVPNRPLDNFKQALSSNIQDTAIFKHLLD